MAKPEQFGDAKPRVLLGLPGRRRESDISLAGENRETRLDMEMGFFCAIELSVRSK